MSDFTEVGFGSDVACADGACGILSRVIIDPLSRALTHLVVEPRHRAAAARLVPIGIAVWTDGDVRLQCTRDAFDELDEASERLLPTGTDPAAAQLRAMPFLRFGGMLSADRPDPHPVTSDVVPLGEAEVRGGDHVYATDAPIGRIRGLIIGSLDHQLEQVLLDEGHIFGKQEVAIPAGAVAGVADGVVLNLTAEEVRGLPAFRREGRD